MKSLVCVALLFLPRWVAPFLTSYSNYFVARRRIYGRREDNTVRSNGSKNSNDVEIMVHAQLDDEKVTSLFAWVSLAFRGDPEYNNLMLAVVAIFGNLPPSSLPVQMVEKARKLLPDEEELVGDKFSIQERESNSLGCVSFERGLTRQN
jgi:hypothetical protein